MTNMTRAQEWARIPNTHGTTAIRPSLLANEIDGAFNCVAHVRLNDILKHYHLPDKLVKTITAFNQGRTKFVAFDGKQ